MGLWEDVGLNHGSSSLIRMGTAVTIFPNQPPLPSQPQSSMSQLDLLKAGQAPERPVEIDEICDCPTTGATTTTNKQCTSSK